jgi:tetratricopeptide (TPR) repeat protein
MREVMLDRLLGALPELGDLAVLRQALLSASVIDPVQAWSRTSAYATYDKRAVPVDALQQVIGHAAQTAHARVDALYASMQRVLYALATGDRTSAAQELLNVGERLQNEENAADAIVWFEAADRVAEQAGHRVLRARALWQLAIAQLSIGATDEAEAQYRASLAQATAAEDAEGRINATIGLGNVAGYQGKHDESLRHYAAALDICGAGYPRRRALLHTNMAHLLVEQGNLEAAAHQLAQASEQWTELSAADHCRWYNARGMLALRADEVEMAESLLYQALGLATSDFERAMVLDNLAELFVGQGNLSEAESLARSAEEAALRAGAPRALAEIYTRLGKIFRLRADPNGVTFFEKAVELCRGRRYPHTEANAYLEYGIFRRLHGDIEEARSYFERAGQLFREVGAVAQERAAAEQLAL